MTSRVHVLPPPSQPTPPQKITIGGKTYTIAEIELKIAAADAAINQSVDSPVDTPPSAKIIEPGSPPTAPQDTQAVPAVLTPSAPKQIVIHGVPLSHEQLNQLFQNFLESLAPGSL